MAWSLFKKKSPKPQAAVPQTAEELLPDDKKSKIVVATGKTNTALVAVACCVLTLFFASVFMKTQPEKNAEEAAVESAAALPLPMPTESDAPRIPPQLMATPSTASIQDAAIGEETTISISVDTANAPAKITDVQTSVPVGSLTIDNDCSSKSQIDVSAGCTVNLFYTPTKFENRSIFINVSYIDPQDAAGAEKSFKIPLVLSTADEEEEDFEEEDEEEDFEEEEAPAPVSVAPVASKRTVYPDDCKKFSSKVYDFSGVFVGWAYGNKDVFSPNCSKLIGQLQEDGMVLEAGTGKIIGKGVVSDLKKAADRRGELALPVLGEIADSVRVPKEPAYDDQLANRELAKANQYGGKKDTSSMPEEWDVYRADDPLSIMKKQKNSMVPFTIQNGSQISSDPKDERYVLRRAKPIPAVLVRPIYFPGTEELASPGDRKDSLDYRTDAIATVERNVYGGDGRTVIIPAGSQLLGSADPPPDNGIANISKVNIVWERLIRPDGAEFNLGAASIGNYTADAQGRYGVAGKNDTGYMKDLIMKPILYSALPVAMEAIFPSTSSYVTRTRKSNGAYNVLDANAEDGLLSGADEYDWQPDQTSTIASLSPRDKMKLEVQQNWKTVAQKMMEKSMQQRIPFTIPSGTRIQIYLENDVMLKIDDNIEDLIDNSGQYTFDNGD